MRSTDRSVIDSIIAKLPAIGRGRSPTPRKTTSVPDNEDDHIDENERLLSRKKALQDENTEIYHSSYSGKIYCQNGHRMFDAHDESITKCDNCYQAMQPGELKLQCEACLLKVTICERCAQKTDANGTYQRASMRFDDDQAIEPLPITSRSSLTTRTIDDNGSVLSLPKSTMAAPQKPGLPIDDLDI